jgi:hypothetical protein
MLSLILGLCAARVPSSHRVVSMDSSDSPDQKSCSACGAGWLFPLLLAILLGGILLARLGGVRDGEEAVVKSPPTSADRVAAGKAVSMVVDSGDGQLRQFDSVPWHEGMTIEDLLGAARQLPDSPEFAKQGSGASAFLTRIGGLANEGAAGRNWTYQINDQGGDRSFAVYELQPGDRVLWKFGPQE